MTPETITEEVTTNSEYAKVFQSELDRQVSESATSGFMEDNAGQVIYNGGKEVKVPVLALKGLANYDRDEGYSTGAVTFTYETKVLSQDRGRRFRLDAVDVTEQTFGVAAATVAGEFQRTKVIPEIDAYRYSKLAGLAGKPSYSQVITKANAVTKLSEAISSIQEETGGEGELVVVIARPVYDLLLASTEIAKTLEVGNFTQGELTTEVKKFNGAVVIPVPSARMKDAYIFRNDAEGGFAPEETAKSINWIILPKTAAVAVAKTDNIKIISPENNQFADAWDVDYRKYHDLYLPEGKEDLVAVSFVQAEDYGE